jgi:Fe-S cluster assembly iron-binding protein IscA
VLELTDDAVEAVKELASTSLYGATVGGIRITMENLDDAVQLRVDVVSLPAEDDDVIEHEQARVFLGPETAAVLDEKILDVMVGQNKVIFTITDQV